MPIKKCQKDKNEGYKYGDKGKCYTGKSARKKAIKQGVAIKISQKGGKKK